MNMISYIWAYFDWVQWNRCWSCSMRWNRTARPGTEQTDW